jgi:arylsulfatase A-like enzyme
MSRRAALIAGSTVAAAMALILGLSSVASGPPQHRAKQIILVTIDTLRADYLGCYGYRAKPTSPNLDAWAKEAVVFDKAMSQAPWTVPSLSSAITGHYPVEVGAYTNRCGINPAFPTLPEILRSHGYETAAFFTHPLLARERNGFGRGFDEVYPDAKWLGHPPGEKLPYAELEPTVMHWLDRHANDSFFIWIHDMDTHPPATRGNPYLTKPGWGGYAGEVRWVDEAMGHLIDKLKALGVWDNALFIFTADHGEAFGEHHLAGHQNVMYDEVLRVPLMVHHPGTLPVRIEEPVELFDVFATISDYAGVKPPPEIHSQSLRPLIEQQRTHLERPLVFEARYHYEGGYHKFAVRDREWKLLVTTLDQNILKPAGQTARERQKPHWDLWAPGTKLELYHYSIDPLEKMNVADQHPKTNKRLLADLAAWQNEVTVSAKRMTPVNPVLDQTTRDALHALGYD